MEKTKILIVDDEADLRAVLKYNFIKEDFVVETAENGEEALKILQNSESKIDLILLDLMMPKLNGLETCKIIKENPQLAEIPIIMLTAKGEESDIVLGLELGADDYITKPFSLKVVIARMKAALRRKNETNSNESAEILTFNELKIDTKRREVYIENQLVKTTYGEFELLLFLAKSPNWVKSRLQIIKAVHGEDYPVTDRAIDVQVVSLRKKLENSGWRVDTIRGIGYRFVTEKSEE